MAGRKPCAAASPAVWLLALLGLAAGCDERTISRIGTSDPSELRTPLDVPGNGFTVPGCCSFDLKGGSPVRLSSDSILHVVRLNGREIGIVFGAHDSVEPGPGYRPDGRRSVEGVELRRWRSAAGVRWTAEVPPSAKGVAANLSPYVLRITAECTGADCDWAQAVAESVRF